MRLIWRMLGAVLGVLPAGWALAQEEASSSSAGVDAMAAMSPFSDYTAAAVAIALLAGVLITLVLGGAFAILNFGLLSRRPEDRIGGRTPSDVAILRENVWPPEPEERRFLPARDEDDEDYDIWGVTSMGRPLVTRNEARAIPQRPDKSRAA